MHNNKTKHMNYKTSKTTKTKNTTTKTTNTKTTNNKQYKTNDTYMQNTTKLFF